MERGPSARVRRRRSRPTGSKARVTPTTLHIRHRHQEETLKKSSFVWLGALVALMAMLGANSAEPKTASAQQGEPFALTVCKVGNVVGTFRFRI